MIENEVASNHFYSAVLLNYPHLLKLFTVFNILRRDFLVDFLNVSDRILYR